MVAEHDPKTDRTLSDLAQMARDVVAPTASIDDAPTSTVVTITQAQTVSRYTALTVSSRLSGSRIAETRVDIENGCGENKFGLTPEPPSIGELQDEVKQLKRRVEELRRELDDERDLVRRLRENAEQYRESIEAFCEAGMEMTDDGSYSWETWWDARNKLVEDYSDLARRWNRFLPVINGGAGGQNVGRPLQASKAQCAEVLTRHKAGESLRCIAEATSLGLRTVRTIIAKQSGTDRTSRKHRQRAERIEIDRQQKATWKRQRRTGDHLPKRMNRYLKETATLIKEAKGL